MKSFLESIARYYLDREAYDLSEYCFILPNKRSGVFLNHFFSTEAALRHKTILHPAVTTITDFICDITGEVEASRLEQLFTLYVCYRDIVRRQWAGATEKDIDFNRFQFWGDIVLTDFTDVDKYMVDPADIFHNIEALKEINSNYLTDEQIEVIRRYWGTDHISPEIADFWQHITHRDKNDRSDRHPSSAGFVKLWQVLHELYLSFNSSLHEQGLSYAGAMYRKAVELLKETGCEGLEYKRYVFIGFNVLSTAEEKIFALMRDAGLADFWWDYASPAFDDKQNRATRFLSQYIKDFPVPDDGAILMKRADSFPKINVIAIPSTLGQVREAATIVSRLDKADLSTAIVLPDEHLCLPLIDSLPDGLGELNITMGYPMRNSPVASLVNQIVTMQLRSRRTSDGHSFFRDDVIQVLTHPTVHSISASACDTLISRLNECRYMQVPVSMLATEEFSRLKPLWDFPADDKDVLSILDYFERLISWLLSLWPLHVTEEYDDMTGTDAIDNTAESEEDKDAATAINAALLTSYLNSINELRELYLRFFPQRNVTLTDSTVFRLIERILGNQSVSFKGEPLKGLQIMGVLETRSLDFENVIILSMNEKVFPRKHFSRSFIPAALRRGYGMSTLDHQESISAYYFYRLISRAENVWLIYDSRTSDINSGEVSRYINQLKYIYHPADFNEITYDFPVTAPKKQVMEIAMLPAWHDELKKYTADGPDKRTLSAHSINMLVDCPLNFILTYLEGYKEEDEVNDFIDDATYGTIVHEVVQNLYINEQERLQQYPLIIDHECISRLSNESVIRPLVDRAIRKEYLHIDPDDPRPVQGEAEIIAKLIVPMVRQMLCVELDGLHHLEFIAAEKEMEGRVAVSPRLSFNFKMLIDRIDRAFPLDGSEPYLRIVDYKTGSDELSVTSIAKLFNPGDNNIKAILQLFLYCNAYAQLEEGVTLNTRIQPIIYKFRDISRDNRISPLRIARTPLTDYLDFNEEFLEELEKFLTPYLCDDQSGETIALPEKVKHCEYCQFNSICH